MKLTPRDGKTQILAFDVDDDFPPSFRRKEEVNRRLMTFLSCLVPFLSNKTKMLNWKKEKCVCVCVCCKRERKRERVCVRVCFREKTN